MAVSFQSRNANTAGNVNKETRKKASVSVNSRNNLNQGHLPITQFLTKTTAQLRGIIYNELALPVFIPLPFLAGIYQFGVY